jgi:hypothetical protein
LKYWKDGAPNPKEPNHRAPSALGGGAGGTKSFTTSATTTLARALVANNAFVRRYIHENLCYRLLMLPDGRKASAVEATIKSGGWVYGRPILNPSR